MSIKTPEQLAKSFVKNFNNRDVDGLVGLFAEGAVFIPESGTVLSGDNIRPAVEGFLALNAPIDLTVKRVIQAGKTAEIIADWRLEAVDQNGDPLILSGTTADVAIEEADGNWRYLIDNPFGTV